MFENPSDTWINSSMLHNRLNFKAYPGTRTTIALEVRNRFVTGDMLSLLDPSYASATRL
ncbi:MAG: U32 family peptidase C-terminal domain-containing protein [Marinilabiliales bacterium]|nr:U32 family peptidase C-terminal domain-containing protein [Marinilabiliales bacterium]